MVVFSPLSAHYRLRDKWTGPDTPLTHIPECKTIKTGHLHLYRALNPKHFILITKCFTQIMRRRAERIILVYYRLVFTFTVFAVVPVGNNIVLTGSVIVVGHD